MLAYQFFRWMLRYRMPRGIRLAGRDHPGPLDMAAITLSFFPGRHRRVVVGTGRPMTFLAGVDMGCRRC